LIIKEQGWINIKSRREWNVGDGKQWLLAEPDTTQLPNDLLFPTFHFVYPVLLICQWWVSSWQNAWQYDIEWL
jgi:hypothetical protein